MNQHVSALGDRDQVGARFGIAADDDRATLVIKSIAVGGRDRRVIDGECGDLESVLLEHRRSTAGAWRRAGRSVDFHRERLHLPVLGRHQRDPVMRDAIAFIERVGLRESVHHLIDADRSVHAQRMVASIGPGLDVELAEIADVIGMKMREHDGGDARRGNVPQRQVLPRAGTDIDEVDVAAGEDRGAGSGALAIGQRIAGAAQHHSERVGREQVVASLGEGARDHAAENRVLHRGNVNHPPRDGGERRKRGGCQNQSSRKF